MRPPWVRMIKKARGLPTNESMVRRLLNRLRTDERGFTLVEQLVVAVGLVFIVSAIAGMTEVAERMAPQDNARNHTVREAQTGIDRMTRELRHADQLTLTGTNLIDARVQMRGRPEAYSVRYDCRQLMPGSASLRRCVRTEPGGTGRSEVVVENVRNATSTARPLFAVTSRDGLPSYVKTLFEMPASGSRKGGAEYGGAGHRVVLEDGFYLRNVDAARGF